MNDTLIRLNRHWNLGKYNGLHDRELLSGLIKNWFFHIFTCSPEYVAAESHHYFS